MVTVLPYLALTSVATSTEYQVEAVDGTNVANTVLPMAGLEL